MFQTKDHLMTRRPLDSVQIAGWTSDAVTRAVRLLTVGSCPDPDGVALAQELLRWLRCAADEDAAELADYIDTIRPSGAAASPWDKLRKSLCEEPLSDVIVRLQAERPGLVGELCALLDDDAEHHSPFDSLDREAQCAVTGLIVLGTAEGLRYLVSHISLLCWNDAEALNQLARPHREAFGRAAVDVWNALDWGIRGTLVLTFAENELLTPPLVELLLAIDGEVLNYRDRARYVHALSCTEDAQATARIHDLLNRALEAPAQLGADGKQFVTEAISYLRRNTLTADQRRRVAECGVDLDWNGCEIDDDWSGCEIGDVESSDAIH
jgi:hypothetical protein